MNVTRALRSRYIASFSSGTWKSDGCPTCRLRNILFFVLFYDVSNDDKIPLESGNFSSEN